MFVFDECAELSDFSVLLSALLGSAVDVLSLHCFDFLVFDAYVFFAQYSTSTSGSSKLVFGIHCVMISLMNRTSYSNLLFIIRAFTICSISLNSDAFGSFVS